MLWKGKSGKRKLMEGEGQSKGTGTGTWRVGSVAMGNSSEGEADERTKANKRTTREFALATLLGSRETKERGGLDGCSDTAEKEATDRMKQQTGWDKVWQSEKGCCWANGAPIRMQNVLNWEQCVTPSPNGCQPPVTTTCATWMRVHVSTLHI